jgi:hypothetical protein
MYIRLRLESGMDDLFLKRVLFEWLRDRYKEQAHAETPSLKEIADRVANPLIFQRWVPVLSLRALATSSRGLKKDYPWSDDFEKFPVPSFIYNYYFFIALSLFETLTLG